MGKKTKKFLIICGIVVGAGLLLTIIGAAAGGISSIDKLATRYTWIAGPAEEEQQQTLDPSQTFDAVKVTGDADLDIMKGSEDSVKLIYPKDMGNYQMEVKDGTLLVNYSYDKRTLINFSSEDSSPRLVITRKDPSSIKTVDADLSWGDVLLQNMTIDSAVLKLSDGDVDLTGSQIGTLNAELDYGDIEGDHVSCTTLSVNLKDGDCELDGTFNGDVNISSQYGDIEIFTRLAESQYTVSAGSSYGDVEVGGTTKEDGGTLTLGAGPYKMALQSDDGDVNVRFGSK